MSDHAYQKQAHRIKTIGCLFLALLLGLSLTLTACGKKPGRVDPPLSLDKEQDTYPLTYPDPATDPKPDSGNR